MTSQKSHPGNSSTILWAVMGWKNFGSHSGLYPLHREIDAAAPGLTRPIARPAVNSVTILKSRLRKAFQMDSELKSIQKGYPFYEEIFWRQERQIQSEIRRTHPFAVVLESIEDQYYLLPKKRTDLPRTRVVGISHYPPAWWRLLPASHHHAQSLDALIVLGSKARAYWEPLLGPEKVVSILHGVDVDFFTPPEVESKPSTVDGILRVVFAGRWLRDFETLAQVVAMADKLDLPIRFDLVVHHLLRNTDACYRMAMSPRVHWHSSLSDEQLRQIYREADMLLLTLTDSVANNALLEGMSCELPVVVTDIGDVRDYAREDFADFVRPRDAGHVIEILQSYMGQTEKLKLRGRAARNHVGEYLSWRKIAVEYLALLNRLGKGSSQA